MTFSVPTFDLFACPNPDSFDLRGVSLKMPSQARSPVIRFIKTSCAVIALGTLAACGGAPQDSLNSNASDDGIVGGVNVEADSSQAKTVAMIHDLEEQTVCTGTLIGEDLILTAGHCAISSAKSLRVSFGTSSSEGEGKVMHKVVKLKRHEDYKKSRIERNDVALLKFKGARPKNSVIASLPDGSEALTYGSTFLAVGYGRSNGKMNRFDLPDGIGTLRQVPRQIEFLRFSDKEFVADQLDGKGVCFGDSGGPALVFRADSSPVIIGIASGIFRASADTDDSDLDFDSCTQKGLYMNVLQLNSWIVNAIAELSKGAVK